MATISPEICELRKFLHTPLDPKKTKNNLLLPACLPDMMCLWSVLPLCAACCCDSVCRSDSRDPWQRHTDRRRRLEPASAIPPRTPRFKQHKDSNCLFYRLRGRTPLACVVVHMGSARGACLLGLSSARASIVFTSGLYLRSTSSITGPHTGFVETCMCAGSCHAIGRGHS